MDPKNDVIGDKEIEEKIEEETEENKGINPDEDDEIDQMWEADQINQSNQMSEIEEINRVKEIDKRAKHINHNHYGLYVIETLFFILVLILFSFPLIELVLFKKNDMVSTSYFMTCKVESYNVYQLKCRNMNSEVKSTSENSIVSAYSDCWSVLIKVVALNNIVNNVTTTSMIGTFLSQEEIDTTINSLNNTRCWYIGSENEIRYVDSKYTFKNALFLPSTD